MRQFLFGFSRQFFQIIAIGLLLLPGGLALAQSTSAKVKGSQKEPQAEVKKSDQDEKDQNKNKSANQSVAQGLTVAEAALLKESPWGFFFSTSVDRGLDEYADTLMSSTSLNMSYRLNQKSSLGFLAEYRTVMLKPDGELFNNEADDPGQFGFEDTEISYIMPGIWSDKYNRLLWSTTLVLPTSRASSRAGLNAMVRSGFSLRYRPNSKLMITPVASINARSYRYDTANAFGTAWNTPGGFTLGVNASYIFLPWLISTLSYSAANRYDFNDHWRTIQTGVAQVNISATDSINAYAGYLWRDQTVSNDALFDDDKSLIYTGVGYAF